LRTSFYLRSLWRRLTTSRHARTLETELARERAANAGQGIEITRLRGENRALLNSILGTPAFRLCLRRSTISPLRKVKTRRHLPSRASQIMCAPAQMQPRTSPRQRAAVPGRKSTASSNSNPRKKKNPPRIRCRQPFSSTGNPACANATSHLARRFLARITTAFFSPFACKRQTNAATVSSHRDELHMATCGTGRIACAT